MKIGLSQLVPRCRTSYSSQIRWCHCIRSENYAWGTNHMYWKSVENRESYGSFIESHAGKLINISDPLNARGKHAACVCVCLCLCVCECVCVCIWSDVFPVITHPCITVHSVKRWGLRYLLPARKKITMHRGRPCFPCTDSSCGNMCFTLCAAGPVLLSAGDSACESFWWTSEQPSSRRKVKFLGFRVLLDEVWGI